MNRLCLTVNFVLQTIVCSSSLRFKARWPAKQSFTTRFRMILGYALQTPCQQVVNSLRPFTTRLTARSQRSMLQSGIFFDQAAFFFRPTFAFFFVLSGSDRGVKSGSLAILLRSESNLRIAGTIAHLCEWP